MKINPAALRALLDGDFENAVIASTPGGIEAQETAGQMALVSSEVLPRKCNYGTQQEQLEAIGIVYGDEVDDLFVNVTLPAGWRKIATGHSMWSKLLDDKGRERASIFYKAAFYDRDAFINIERRYRVHVEPVDGWDDNTTRSEREWQCGVVDGDTPIWTSEPLRPEPPYSVPEQREAWLAWYKEKDALSKQGQVWLDEHFPDWQDPTAHWD